MNMVQDEKISFREARREDIPALAILAGEAFWEAFTGKMPEEDLLAYVATAFTPEQLLLEWEEPTNTFLIGLFGEQWAGFAKVTTGRKPMRTEEGAYIELERLYLLRQYHGRKIGALLMGHVIQYAREHGFAMLWLNVWEKNTEARAFYGRWGFELIDWSIFLRGNDQQKGLWMRKEL